MKIILSNNSSDNFSYVGGLVTVSAGGTTDVASGFWTRLYADLQFLSDLRNNNILVSDGATTRRYEDSENYIKFAIANLQFTSVRKDFSFSSTQTNVVLWTPTSGKKFVVTDLSLNIRNNTLGALTVAIFDDTNAAGNYLYKANFEAGSNYDAISNLITPFFSSAINKSLKITTSGGLMISGNVQGYETE